MTRSSFGKLVMFGLAVLFSMGAAKVASAQTILNIPVIILYPPPHFAPSSPGSPLDSSTPVPENRMARFTVGA